jgi:hypothetical protein
MQVLETVSLLFFISLRVYVCECVCVIVWFTVCEIVCGFVWLCVYVCVCMCVCLCLLHCPLSCVASCTGGGRRLLLKTSSSCWARLSRLVSAGSVLMPEVDAVLTSYSSAIDA